MPCCPEFIKAIKLLSGEAQGFEESDAPDILTAGDFTSGETSWADAL
jgi:hypothetical protein